MFIPNDLKQGWYQRGLIKYDIDDDIDDNDNDDDDDDDGDDYEYDGNDFF